MKKILITIIIFSFLLPISTVAGEDILEETYYRKPVVELLDLNVDGSISPYLVNITESFDYMMRMIWNLEFTDNDLDFGEFAGATALTNGSYITYDGESFDKPIKSLADFADRSYDARIDKDDKNPVGNHLVSRLSFFKFVPPYGLKIKDGHTFSVVIQDNITSYGCDFYLIVEGFKDVNYEPDFQRDWLEDMFVFDNPLKFVALIFTIPAVMIFTWEPVGMMVGAGIAVIELFVINGIWRKLTED